MGVDSSLQSVSQQLAPVILLPLSMRLGVSSISHTGAAVAGSLNREPLSGFKDTVWEAKLRRRSRGPHMDVWLHMVAGTLAPGSG